VEKSSRKCHSGNKHVDRTVTSEYISCNYTVIIWTGLTSLREVQQQIYVGTNLQVPTPTYYTVTIIQRNLNYSTFSSTILAVMLQL
jgi:hypothetical protein